MQGEERLRRFAYPPPRCRQPRALQLGNKYAVSISVALAKAPLLDRRESNPVVHRDRHSDAQALPVIPMIVGSEPVTARVGRRQGKRSRPALALPHRTDLEVFTDAQRPPRKLHVERQLRVYPMVAVPLESERVQGPIKDMDRRLFREDKVDIHRCI